MLSPFSASLELVRVSRTSVQMEWGNIMPIWNTVAAHAYRDGADYFYLVNDDLEMVTPGWASTLVEMLRSNPLYPNFGVAAPVGFEGEEGRNMTYGNFPMVHRTHIQVCRLTQILTSGVRI